jgi:hypothetical protein
MLVNEHRNRELGLGNRLSCLIGGGSATALRGAALGEEQGPKGNGQTFESCRVRQKEVCLMCRDCGGARTALDPLDEAGSARMMTRVDAGAGREAAI